MKRLRLTDHAKVAAANRNIDQAWIERAARLPDWTQADPLNAEAERRFAAVAEQDGRVLRVVCRETDAEISVITVFFDRKAKRPS